MKSIIWSLNSEADLDEIFEFINKDSPQNAVKFVKGLIESVEKILIFPTSGRVVPEYSIGHIREIQYKDYRVVYSVMQEIVLILTVFNGHKELRRYL